MYRSEADVSDETHVRLFSEVSFATDKVRETVVFLSACFGNREVTTLNYLNARRQFIQIPCLRGMLFGCFYLQSTMCDVKRGMCPAKVCGIFICGF